MINGSLQAFAIKAPEKEMPSVMEIMLTVNEIKLALAPWQHSGWAKHSTLNSHVQEHLRHKQQPLRVHLRS